MMFTTAHHWSLSSARRMWLSNNWVISTTQIWIF